MADSPPSEPKPSGFSAFWEELRRRHVVRVALVYLVVGWLVIQVANATFADFGIPVWAYRFVVLMVALGFPISVILAWAFELTPEGIKTTKVAQKDNADSPHPTEFTRKRKWMTFAFGAAFPTAIFGALAVYFYATRTVETEPTEFDKSIAVLPFTNMSANQEHAFFADGVHETILTDLANLRDMRVVSRTSVMPYRGSDKSIITIGQELGVAYILEGSMQRAENAFRLTAQLIDARTDEHLWAKNFDGELTNIFSVQSQLAKDVAQGLQAILSPQEEQYLDRAKSASIEAYDLYLKAKEIHHISGSTVSPDALALLNKAVELDPTFTEAWLLIAEANGFRHKNEVGGFSDAGAEAKRAIEIAARLEPENHMVTIALGNYYYDCHLDYSRAKSFIEPVAERLPNNYKAISSLAFISRREGRWADAVDLMERAHLLSPRDTGLLLNLGSTYRKIRRWDRASETFQKMVAIIPENLRFQHQESQTEFQSDGSVNAWTLLYANGDARLELLEGYYRSLFDVGDLQSFEELAEDWAIRSYKANLFHPFWNANAQLLVLKLLGEVNQAREVFDYIIEEERSLEYDGFEGFQSNKLLGWAHALAGDGARAKAAIDSATAVRSEYDDALSGTDIAVERAAILAWIGAKDEAVMELIRLSKKPSNINYYTLKNSLAYYPLRDHPSFQAFLEDPELKEPLPLKNDYR